MHNPWLDLPSTPPFVLSADRKSVMALSGINLDSMPEPFIGNPDSATVLLLNLNPGDSPDDKKAHGDPKFRENLLCNLRHGVQEYLFYPLDPAVRWTPCGDWWCRHVRELLEHPKLSRERIAQRLCVVEWFPYHSKDAKKLPEKWVCASQLYGFEIGRKAIGKKLIIGMRARKRWTDVDSRLGEVPYLGNHQSPYISVRNCGETLFNQIVDALA